MLENEIINGYVRNLTLIHEIYDDKVDLEKAIKSSEVLKNRTKNTIEYDMKKYSKVNKV
jgi:hypothetical protein